ncbi:anti-sigma factor family protein [Arthrobacter castelli]|uniref:anti-sigma factor family protein n=1 Tax=Arthrobacter castelli TaxID=271431 RepID=UPI0003FDB5C3|nr:zf-HC2 domain-containing protein [Arthrobacter castelli]
MTDRDPDHVQSQSDPFREWDAAYVLGSLTPADRAAYEAHLAECPRCSAAVADLAGLPGILAAVPHDEVLALASNEADGLDEAGGTADGVTARLDAEGTAAGAERSANIRSLGARVRRRQNRWLLAAASAVVVAGAASAAITVAVTGGNQTGPQAGPSPGTTASSTASPTAGPTGSEGSTLAFHSVAPSPLSAEAKLISKPWGSRIEGTCRYPATGRYNGPGGPASPGPGPSGSGTDNRYIMVIVDDDGAAVKAASWRAAPGSVVRPTATTAVPATDIRSVEIRAAGSGEVLLRATAGQ